jgi:hypothetical protein
MGREEPKGEGDIRLMHWLFLPDLHSILDGKKSEAFNEILTEHDRRVGISKKRQKTTSFEIFHPLSKWSWISHKLKLSMSPLDLILAPISPLLPSPDFHIPDSWIPHGSCDVYIQGTR